MISLCVWLKSSLVRRFLFLSLFFVSPHTRLLHEQDMARVSWTVLSLG